jgi:hypothetical protein
VSSTTKKITGNFSNPRILFFYIKNGKNPENNFLFRAKKREVLELDQKLRDIQGIEDYEKSQRQQMRMMNNNLIQNSIGNFLKVLFIFLDPINGNKIVDDQKRRTEMADLAKTEENRKILSRFDAMKEQETLAKKQQKEYKKNLVSDLRSSWQVQQDLRDVELKRGKELDKFYMKEERRVMDQRDSYRANFFKKIRGGFSQNNDVYGYYTNLNQDLQEREKEFMHNIIDVPSKVRQAELLEKEIYERNYRKKMDVDNKKYLINQITRGQEDKNKAKYDDMCRDYDSVTKRVFLPWISLNIV